MTYSLSVPWEAAFCDAPTFSPGWLAVHPRLSLVRFVPLPRPCEIPPRTEPLRILLAHAEAPPGLDSLDYRSEWDAIKSAMQLAIGAGRVQIVAELTQTTEAVLRQHIVADRPHVVHLIAHGKRGIIYLQGNTPGSGHQAVTAAQMANIFKDSQVRLAVFNVCDSVQVGYALAAVGIPAVVAMQGIPSDQFASLFAGEFYGPLSRGRSVDDAMFDARSALAVWPSGVRAPDAAGWCVPVLYLRIPDGCI